MSVLKEFTEWDERAKAFGFYWPHKESLFNQIRSELKEIEDAIEQGESAERIQEEVGDLIHGALCLCRFLGFELDETLTRINDKFTIRMTILEEVAQQEGYASLKGQPENILWDLWKKAKKVEKERKR